MSRVARSLPSYFSKITQKDLKLNSKSLDIEAQSSPLIQSLHGKQLCILIITCYSHYPLHDLLFSLPIFAKTEMVL